MCIRDRIGIYTKDVSEQPSDPSYTFTTISIPNKNNSAINDEALWGSIITDKFYYDESATWTYLTYLTYDSTAQKSSIVYIVSYDLGVEWKTPVTIISDNAWVMRYSISTGYTTPEPYTDVDFLWFTWLDEAEEVPESERNDQQIYDFQVRELGYRNDPMNVLPIQVFGEEEASRMLEMRIGVDQIEDSKDRWK